ncbi:Rha family phage regulatory protein [Baia soyae]|uniref:Rha family phage regulatory protein n=2 Tax=Baia soyae TaxID=1544746 RepID=A0A4R2RXK0_9BACL|nr:Rha family phage regulatory protein [Baia soyae]
MDNNDNNSQLSFIEDKEIMVDSLMVAKIFRKRHDHVIRDIRNLDCSPNFALLNFGESDYMNNRRKVYKKYLLTKDGLMFLVIELHPNCWTRNTIQQLEVLFHD